MAPPTKNRFFEAAFNGNLRLLKQLAKEFSNGQKLAKTFAIVRDEKDRNALHFAASGGKCDICNYLVQKVKLDVNTRDTNGYTAVHHAVLGGHGSTVRYLVQAGADISICATDGCTPLHFASDEGHVEIIEFLIFKGTNVDSMAESGKPLHKAAASGKLVAVKVLLSHKANPNIAVHHFFTPLLMSIDLAESFECLELLLKGGADPSMGACDEQPLGNAACLGNAKMVECLLNYGANPNVVDSSGLTPLECCAVNENHEMMGILFPVTARIESYSDWSIDGIEKHIHTPEFREQRIQEKLLLWKEKGNEAFRKNDYVNAIHWYAKVTMLYLMLWPVLEPEWSKGHYRKGAALKLLKRYSDAAEAFAEALMLDPNNKECEKELETPILSVSPDMYLAPPSVPMAAVYLTT